MKRNLKKGFTLVELVIVIAVIAILAGVLIPTFSNVVAKAQESAAKQNAVNAFKEAYANAMADGEITNSDTGFTITQTGWTYTSGDYTYTYTTSTNTGEWNK